MELSGSPDSKDATTIRHNTGALEIANHFESMTIFSHGQRSSTGDDQAMAVQSRRDVVDKQQPQPDDFEEQQPQPDDFEEQQPQPDAVDEQPQPQPDAVDEQPQPQPDAVDEQQPQPDAVDEQQPQPDAVDEQQPQPDAVDEQQLVNPGPMRQVPPNQIANVAACQGNQLHQRNCMFYQLPQLLPIGNRPPLNHRRQNEPRIINRNFPHRHRVNAALEMVRLTFNSPNLKNEMSITTSRDTPFEELFFVYMDSRVSVF